MSPVSFAMKRPPRSVVFAAVIIISLAATGGAAIGKFKRDLGGYFSELIYERKEVHGLTGRLDLDEPAVADTVYWVEAGLSFFHTHGEGVGVLVLCVSTAVSTLASRRLRRFLNLIIGLGAFFPLGYLSYSFLIISYGKDRGIQLAQYYLLIPFGMLALVAVGILSALIASGHCSTRGRNVANEEGATWRLPPLLIIGASMVLILLAEGGGGAMVRFKRQIEGFSRPRILERPVVHGLVGVREIDELELERITFAIDAGLRLFHLHAEGMGLVVLTVSSVIYTFVGSPGLRRLLSALVGCGLVYPAGYILRSALIIPFGLERGKAIAEYTVLAPFGLASILGLWILCFILTAQLFGGRR